MPIQTQQKGDLSPLEDSHPRSGAAGGGGQEENPLEGILPSFSNCWGTPVTKLQLVKVQKTLQKSSSQLPRGPAVLIKVLLKDGSVTERVTSWECLHLNSPTQSSLGQECEGVLGLSSLCLLTFAHLLRSWEGGLSPFSLGLGLWLFFL